MMGGPATEETLRLDPDIRSRRVQRVLIVTLILNLAAAGVKLAAGVTSGSLALTAGGVDSLFDGGANVLALVGSRAASRPADASHPYGHRKLETLVAAVIVALMFITCGRLVITAIQQLLHPGPPPEVGWAAIAAPLVAFGLNTVAATYESRWGRRLGSELLLADAGHTRADAGVSLALVGGLIAVRAGYPVVDPLLALGIAVVIARVGIQVARETADVLADAAALDPAEVSRIARAVPGVEGVHKVRSRGPRDSVAVDLHVQVDPALGLERGHEIGHEVEERLCASLPGVTDVVVHVEPEWELVGGDITAAVRRVAGRYPVDVHEIHVHTGRCTEVGLHMEMDPTLSLDEAHDMASELEAAILTELPELDRVVTHLEPSANRTQVASEVRAGRGYAELVERETALVRGLFDPHDIEVVEVAGGLRLSMHVRTIGELPLPEAHALAEDLEARLRSAEPGLERITIHLEPA